ncbi:tol-pal system-associated acyl-CoA thioesterase [Vineibacter terrae]|uniref:tol-pal system-associated acyl-CoA thioesterase n=1 Tax=Vineibacter terrae TaxID=2586908 RepID=UPI002E37FCF2|nr:tol-pal system-associated acyl-CoA thioesterase [Vineibacter terrae]
MPGPAPVSSAPVPPANVPPAHVLPVRVYYEDTDAGGIVYHANYLRFMERGRTEMLRGIGHDLAAQRQAQGVNWTVSRLAIRYLRPARLDEALEVVTQVAALRGASVDLVQQVRRADGGGTGALLSDATLTLACMGADGRPVRLPADVRAALAVAPAGGGA